MFEITPRQLEIIESAGKILTESGVSGLTTKKLAAKIGFSEAALYRHFKGKEAIIVTLLKFLADNMEKRFSNINSEHSIEKRFKTLFQSQHLFFKKNPHFVVAVFSDGLMEESKLINAQIHNIMRVKMKYLSPIIIEGQQTAFFTNKITAEELTYIIMGAFRLQMFKWRSSHFEFDIERTGNNLIESLLTILKK